MTVKLALRGLRGESAADIARRTLAITGTDKAAIQALMRDDAALELILDGAEDARDEAQTAETAAELARDLAQGYASNAATVSGVNVPIYASVATAEGSTIVAGVKAIRTEYRAPTYGDLATLIGGALYARASKATIDAATYPAAAYFRSTDRFMPDGSTDATNGGYWLYTASEIRASALGYSAGGTAAANATALGDAIKLANILGRGVVIDGVDAYVGALATLPTTGKVRLRFEPGAVLRAPGDGAAATSDITLMAPTTDFSSEGRALFVGYRRCFDFDGIAADAVVEAEGHTYSFCGRAFDYAGGSRIDFNPAFGCRNTSANTIKKWAVGDFRLITDASSRVCEFGVVWRGGYEEGLIDGFSVDGVGRMGYMTGDNSTWFKCKNTIIQNVVIKNCYPRVGTATEFEIHGGLSYGRRIVMDNLLGDTCYDLHASTHDSEMFYAKCMIGSASNVHVRNGGRGDAYFSFKGQVATAAEMDDPDAQTGGTPLQAFVQLNNITVQASPDFVTAYGKISGVYSNAGRIELDGFQVIGDFDRGVNFSGYSRVSDGTIRGNCTYGVLVTARSEDTEGPAFADLTYEGDCGGAPFEYRIATASGTVTIPLVEFSNCRARLKEGALTPAGAFNVRVEKSAGQNRVEVVRFPGCVAYSTKTTSNCAAYAASTDLGSGANEGQIGTFELADSSAYGTSFITRFSGTAGKIDFLTINGGVAHLLTSAMFSNPTNATKIRVGAIRCPTTNYETEKSGTATILSGASTVTITPSWNTSRQATIMPDAINQIQIIEPDDLRGAARLAVTSVNSTTGAIVVTARDAAGAAVNVSANVVLGWRAINRYFN